MDVIVTVLSIILALGIAVGLYFNPSPSSLIMIVTTVSLLLYGIGRYWRHPEGFVSKR